MHRMLTRALLLSSASAALLSFGANAQPVEEVVVTGSHIRGVAPVGSTIVSVTNEDFAKTAAPDAYTMLRKVPQLTNIGLAAENQMGGNRAQGAAGNTTLVSTINLRGVSGTATLTLVNGERQAAGSAGITVDPNNYPSSLIGHVDVQADGGSAIYGSDAVAGTVNFILREPDDIVQTTGQVAFKKGNSMDWLVNATLGTTWDTASTGLGEGGIVVAYEHNFQDSLSAAALSYAYTDDLTPYFPGGVQPTNSTPGNVRGFGTTATAVNVLYAAPGSGIGPRGQVTLSQLGAANVPNRTSAYEKASNVLPQQVRDTFAGILKQDLAPWLHFTLFGHYNTRGGRGTNGSTPQTIANITLPNTNPYGPCATPAAAASAGLPPPSPANTQGLVCPTPNPANPTGNLTVLYNFVNEYGGAKGRWFSTTAYQFAPSFGIDLPYEWHAKIAGNFSKHREAGYQGPEINLTALNQVVSGVGKPANVPFLNPFCSDAAGPCNSQITLDYIRAFVKRGGQGWIWDFNGTVDGPLFDLPGGTVKLALGAGYQESSISIFNDENTSAAIGTIFVTNNTELTRVSRALFGEIYVPIVGEGNAMPGIRSLELTAAARYTTYTLPKVTTTNPKFGINWKPVDDVKVHASYGTSFRAPNLRELNPGAAATVLFSQPQSCTTYVGITCPPGVTTLNASYFFGGPGPGGLQPEKGKSWGLGVDWTPESIPGLDVSVTYYKLTYTNLIAQAAGNAFPVAVANAGIYDDLVVFNPTFFPTRARVNSAVLDILPGLTRGAALTQAQFNSILPTLALRPQYAPVATVPQANPIPFVADGRFINTGGIWTDGFDFQGTYAFDTDWGSAHVGVLGTYVLTYDVETVTGSGVIDRANEFNFNVRLKGRLEAGLEADGWDVTAYMNYTNPYTSDPAFIPAAALALNPNFAKIDSDITFDLSLGYSTPDDISVTLLRNIRANLVVTNVFDTKPPFFLNASAAPPILYDPTQASAVGRIISFRVSKNW